MKVLVYSIFGFDKPFIEKAAQGKHELVFTEQSLNENTANLAKGFDAVSLFTSDTASASVLEKLHTYGIQYIALRSVGHDHIDLVKAESLGIKVANVPAYSPYAVAEHTVALLMALNRKLILGQKLTQIGDYRLDHLVGFDLYGKTVGIIGTGKIGAAFAKIMHGFGCKLLAYDLSENKELIRQTNISYTSLEDLCQKSDVISVHCPLNSATKYMFNKNTFALMKKGIVFINTARGSLVDTVDLMEALENGTISAAGLDVYENEKTIFFKDHTSKRINDEMYANLRSFPNVLITGHQAFLTNEALQGIANTTIANLNAWAHHGISENEVKPFT
jgi:D-lactate dehydrogenase